MSSDRQWMYNRLSGGYLNPEFVEGVLAFVQFAISQPEWADGPRIRCPCGKCKNRKFLETETVKLHLVQKGFVADYYEWRLHGETITHRNYEWGECHTSGYATKSSDPYCAIVMDAAGPDFIRLRNEMSQSEEGSSDPHQVDDNQIFIENVKEVKKSRVYGIGSEVSTQCSTAFFSGTSPTTDRSQELEVQLQHMQEENKLLREQLKDLQEQMQRFQKEMQRFREEMKRQMQRFQEEMKRQIQEQVKAQLAASFNATPQPPTYKNDQ